MTSTPTSRGAPETGAAGHRLTLEPASAADVEWLLQLRLTTMGGHLERSGQHLSLDEQRERVLQDFAAIRIVKLGREPIGMMKVVRDPERFHLVQIQLEPRLQGQGIGSRLIHELLEEARRAGTPVSLHVLKVNPAKRLYDRLGFRVVADEGHSYEMLFDG